MSTKKIISSKVDPLRKINFKDNFGKQYYTVSFYDKADNSVNLCVSSQIGCVEKCAFCATGDAPFIRNLTQAEMEEQYTEGIKVLSDFSTENHPRTLYIILEGMGEASYNLANCLSGFSSFFESSANEFDKIAFRVSTAGNVSLIAPYKQFITRESPKMPNVQFQFQVSLHTPFDEERRFLVPRFGIDYPIGEMIPQFKKFADFLKSPLKFNYMLLRYPDGRINYSQKHLEKLVSISAPLNARVKLTKYSDTGKGFLSPSGEVYEDIRIFLETNGVKTSIRPLFGLDINAACGMLDYR